MTLTYSSTSPNGHFVKNSGWQIFKCTDTFTSPDVFLLVTLGTSPTTQIVLTLKIKSPVFKVSFSVCCMIFLKFSNKSKYESIDHSKSFMITIFPTYLYGENELLWVPVPSFGVCLREKTPPVSREHICNQTLLQIYPCLV